MDPPAYHLPKWNAATGAYEYPSFELRRRTNGDLAVVATAPLKAGTVTFLFGNVVTEAASLHPDGRNVVVSRCSRRPSSADSDVYALHNLTAGTGVYRRPTNLVVLTEPDDGCVSYTASGSDARVGSRNLALPLYAAAPPLREDKYPLGNCVVVDPTDLSLFTSDAHQSPQPDKRWTMDEKSAARMLTEVLAGSQRPTSESDDDGKGVVDEWLKAVKKTLNGTWLTMTACGRRLLRHVCEDWHLSDDAVLPLLLDAALLVTTDHVEPGDVLAAAAPSAWAAAGARPKSSVARGALSCIVADALQSITLAYLDRREWFEGRTPLQYLHYAWGERTGLKDWSLTAWLRATAEQPSVALDAGLAYFRALPDEKTYRLISRTRADLAFSSGWQPRPVVYTDYRALVDDPASKLYGLGHSAPVGTARKAYTLADGSLQRDTLRSADGRAGARPRLVRDRLTGCAVSTGSYVNFVVRPVQPPSATFDRLHLTPTRDVPTDESNRRGEQRRENAINTFEIAQTIGGAGLFADHNDEDHGEDSCFPRSPSPAKRPRRVTSPSVSADSRPRTLGTKRPMSVLSVRRPEAVRVSAFSPQASRSHSGHLVASPQNTTSHGAPGIQATSAATADDCFSLPDGLTPEREDTQSASEPASYTSSAMARANAIVEQTAGAFSAVDGHATPFHKTPPRAKPAGHEEGTLFPRSHAYRPNFQDVHRPPPGSAALGPVLGGVVHPSGTSEAYQRTYATAFADEEPPLLDNPVLSDLPSLDMDILEGMHESAAVGGQDKDIYPYSRLGAQSPFSENSLPDVLEWFSSPTTNA